MRTKLTYQQKLEALSFRFYSTRFDWKPKKGDYYTSTRADLELYRIVEEDENNFYTVYCDEEKQGDYPPAVWKKDEFLTGFGENRCFVPESLFKLETPSLDERVSLLEEKVKRVRFKDMVFKD